MPYRTKLIKPLIRKKRTLKGKLISFKRNLLLLLKGNFKKRTWICSVCNRRHFLERHWLLYSGDLESNINHFIDETDCDFIKTRLDLEALYTKKEALLPKPGKHYSF